MMGMAPVMGMAPMMGMSHAARPRELPSFATMYRAAGGAEMPMHEPIDWIRRSEIASCFMIGYGD